MIVFLAATALLPRWWCGRDGQRWYSGDPDICIALAREVASTVKSGVTEKAFTSDSALFRHEWTFGTYQMAALGLLQVCIEHPEFREELLPAAEQAIDRLLTPEVRSFDAGSWDEDPLDSLAGSNGHAAYLGYTNLVLGLHRRAVSGSRYTALNDAISEALARRLRNSSHGILETYPNEGYPIDNAAVLASLLLHARVARADHSDVTTPMLLRYRTSWRDPASGLLYQAVYSRDGRPYDAPRASGTMLAAYFIGMGDRQTAALLLESAKQSCAGSLAGFGFLREYPPGVDGRGDIDSGPLIAGISPSGTGFALASSRMLGERDLFVSLYRTAHLTGAPVRRGDALRFVTGGPLGNAILLAMFTAEPEVKP